MRLEEELTEAMIGLYRRAGMEIGYWAGYFLREVRSKGGLAVARKLLSPERSVSRGFGRVMEEGRADLSVEYLVSRNERFHELFTEEELAHARRRLAALPDSMFPSRRDGADLFPDELSDDETHVEGAKRTVTVNAYERNPTARKRCIEIHGPRCSVCELVFGERYGELGEGFIHVHHMRPIALSSGRYRVNSKTDLVPVCPNCHAMLHRQAPPMHPAELREILRSRGEID